MAKNGRVKTGYVIERGVERHYPEGRFQLRSFDGPKTVYTNAGADAAEALVQRDRLARKLGVVAQAEAEGIQVVEESTRKRIANAIREYLLDTEARGAMVAVAAGRRMLAEFVEAVPKVWLDEINREDMLKFHAAMRRKGNSDRTVAEKDARVRSFLRFAKFDMDRLPPKPKYEAKLPTVYRAKDVSAILDVADGAMAVVIDLALKCGLREQELMHLCWSDIGFDDATLKVRSKPEWGFKVKDAEQREVPVPADVLDRLAAWRDMPGRSGVLVVPTANGQPNTKLLRTLKRLAKRSGVNCGQCDGCRSAHQECRRWTLHEFRRTYATSLLRSGVDLATVQRYMGHSELESTMRYLRPASTSEAQAKINAVSWGT
jgi:integrase